MPQVAFQRHVHSYDPVLVILSITIAVFASWAALDLVGRVAAAEGRARRWWLAAGSVALGIGIWSMHYTGMLALRLPITVMYHGLTVLVSLLVAMLASALALWLAAHRRWTIATWTAGSIVFGCGIAAMHYIGMAAMRLPASMEWNPWRIAASVAIAVIVSAVALRLAFHHGHGETQGWGWHKLGSAVVMGFAIFSMHYTGMSAVSYSTAPMPFSSTGSVSIPLLGAWAIVAATATVLTAAVASSFVDRYIKQMQQYHLTLAEVRTLRGLLSICADCKRIRREDGHWERLETYVRSHTGAEFSHGLCPGCQERFFEQNLSRG